VRGSNVVVEEKDRRLDQTEADDVIESVDPHK
jgi:hypothetical protein